MKIMILFSDNNNSNDFNNCDGILILRSSKIIFVFWVISIALIQTLSVYFR